MNEIKQGQNLIDKCLELTGDLSALLDLAILNGVSITDDLPIGYKVRDNNIVIRKNIVQFFAENEPPATIVSEFDNTDIEDMLGIGQMQIENTFIVR